MNLSEYLRSLQKQGLTDFAGRCGTTIGQLRQVAIKSRRAGESLAINIERESGGVIRCEDLRPDVDWAYLRNSPKQQSEAA